jgi:hypothetical protein
VTGRIRGFLLVESAAFIAALLVHFGFVTTGYEHWKAGTAESVIAAVLLAGLAITWLRPGSAARSRRGCAARDRFTFRGLNQRIWSRDVARLEPGIAEGRSRVAMSTLSIRRTSCRPL